MIENYKGWKITLIWGDYGLFLKNTSKNSSYKKTDKWKGVNLNGDCIYGESLKEIRHIIDYPNLYKS